MLTISTREILAKCCTALLVRVSALTKFCTDGYMAVYVVNKAKELQTNIIDNPTVNYLWQKMKILH